MDRIFNPEAAPPVVDTIARRKRIKRFPYVIIYTLDPDAIYIVAVAHNQRDPDYWLHRLDEPGRQ
jgi:plasmid stabilization system protein ParE